VSATPDDCFHLTIDVVREIHDEALKRFAGLQGIRDENLLASAVLAPQSSFGGKSPFADLIDIAAAYLFYICRNHPFLDGNKRTAMMAAIVFEPAPDSGAMGEVDARYSSQQNRSARNDRWSAQIVKATSSEQLIRLQCGKWGRECGKCGRVETFDI